MLTNIKFIKLTASQLSKAEKCPGSMLLPKSNSSNNNPDNNKLAEKGIIIHKFLELYPKIGLDALDQIDKHKSLCALIPVEKIFQYSKVVLNEVGFRFNIINNTVELVGEGLNWQDLEPNNNNEITGIADCIIEYGKEDDYKILVIDYKTGLAEPAKNNIQLHFLAYCYAIYKQLDSINASVIYIDDNGSLYWDEINISNNYYNKQDVLFSDIRKRLESIHKPLIMALTNTSNVCYFENESCEYCKSLPYCPIYINLTKYLFEKGIDGVKAELEGDINTNKSSLGEIYSKIKSLKIILTNIESEIKSIAKTKPIQLPNKKKLANVVTKKSQLDQSKAMEIVKKLIPELDDTVIDKEINFQKLAKLYPHKIAEVRKELQKSKAYSYYELGIIKEI